MKQLTLKQTNTTIPAIAIGCMRIDNMEPQALAAHIQFCVEQGLNFFDPADIYGGAGNVRRTSPSGGHPDDCRDTHLTPSHFAHVLHTHHKRKGKAKG